MPDDKTLLAFDFGTKRIGVAVGQTVTKSATALITLHAKQGVPNWAEVTTLLQTWHPNALIVGVPLPRQTGEKPITAAARQFAETLRQRYALPVYEMDERLTTKEARQQLFDQGGYQALQKAKIDSIAAKLILEDWLQSHR